MELELNLKVKQLEAKKFKLIKKQLIKKWVNTLLKYLGEKDDYLINLIVVDEVESAQINNKFRGKKNPTNIISIDYEIPIEVKPRFLGDLIICYPILIKEADDKNIFFLDHLAHLIVHGCLHLFKYQHETSEQAEKMESLEIECLTKLKIKNPYA